MTELSEITETIKKNTEAFLTFLREAPVVVSPVGGIAGPGRLDAALLERAFAELPYGAYGDNYHYPMGTACLTYGFLGVAERAEKSMTPDKSEEQTANLAGIAAVYREAAAYLARHAAEVDRMLAAGEGDRAELTELREILRSITKDRPHTFSEAVQLYYMAWRLRSAVSSSTIGRLDQYLYPFYEADLRAGRLTREAALGKICALWEKINTFASGDTLINVMLGGSDEDGRDETNDLSVLMLEAAVLTAKTEPHINVRVHSRTRRDFLDAALRLQLCGFGQATVYYDEAIIPEMVRNGIPRRFACRYANDGCTEIVIDGFSSIHFDWMNAMKAWELALFNGHPAPLPEPAIGKYWTRNGPDVTWSSPLEEGFESGDMAQAASFEELYAMFLKQYFYHLEKILLSLAARHRDMKKNGVVSPFLNGSFPHLLESGDDVLRGGLPVDCVLIFSGSLPTVADGLAAIRTVVFEDRLATVAEIRKALAVNYDGHEVLRQRLLHAPKFGNNENAADEIAADLAKRFFDYVSDFSARQGLTIWPALLSFLFVQEAYYTGATPDGRRRRDPICEHFSPTPGRAVNGPTAVLNSIGKAPLARGFGASVVHLSLSRSMVPNNEEGLAILRRLNEAAGQKGFNFLNVAIYDAERLRMAQKDPEHYGDVIVRVWGYCARFVDLSDDMQEHVIARILRDPV